MLLLVLALGSSWVAAANDRLLFYGIKTERAQVWLLGSMHLARPDIYPLREKIMSAFASADSLVVEVDIGGGNQLAIQQRMLEMGTYPAGKTIREELSARTWSQLESRLQTSGLPPFMFEQMKPGLVVTTLTTMELMKLGLSPELGIDGHFLAMARGQKRIVELETIDDQLSLLLDIDNAELLVKQTLYQMDTLEASMNKLVRKWKAGDTDGLRKLVLDDELRSHPEFRPLQKRMFDDRNRAMTDGIVKLQRSGGTHFVVVGAGHLLGDQGIIALLQKRGQQPRQL